MSDLRLTLRYAAVALLRVLTVLLYVSGLVTAIPALLLIWLGNVTDYAASDIQDIQDIQEAQR